TNANAPTGRSRRRGESSWWPDPSGGRDHTAPAPAFRRRDPVKSTPAAWAWLIAKRKQDRLDNRPYSCHPGPAIGDGRMPTDGQADRGAGTPWRGPRLTVRHITS